MDKIDDFLKRHMLSADDIDEEKILSYFFSEMDKGLEGKESSLFMVPTFTGLPSAIKSGEKAIVLDAGGTNFRTCLVTFKEGGSAEISDFRKTGMPGIKSQVSVDEFFSILAENTERLIDKADRIGFCFSYPAEITDDHDGIALRFSKEIKAPEVIGKKIGKELLDALKKRGCDVKGKKIAIVNDTVATFLATCIKDKEQSSGYIGFILGTGTNTAYAEKNSNIKKIGLSDDGRQIINVESGCLTLRLGDIDKEFTDSTSDKDKSLFEKAISGAYLGPFSNYVIRAAINEGLLSSSFASAFSSIEELDTKAMSDYLESPLFGNRLAETVKDEEDRKCLYVLLDAIIRRAGKLTAVNLTAAVLKSGIGEDPAYPVIINADGTTFYKTRNLEFYTRMYLSSILERKYRRYYRIVNIPDSPVYGAAVAGLII